MNEFFKRNDFIIDENHKMFGSSRTYLIYDTSGNEIGQLMKRASEDKFIAREDLLICDDRGGY